MNSRLALHWQILIGMVAGALLGVFLNWNYGTSEVVLRSDLPEGMQSLSIYDSPDRTRLEATFEEGTSQSFWIAPIATSSPNTDDSPNTDNADSVRQFGSVQALAADYPQVAAVYLSSGQSWAKRIGVWFKRVGSLFLRMLKMVAIPLIVTSLLTGIMGLGDASQFGRMFGQTIAYYAATSFLAIMTGLVAVNVVCPGLKSNAGSIAESSSVSPVGENSKGLGTVLFEQLEAMIPQNPFEALVAPNYLSIIAFTLAIAIFALRVGGETKSLLRQSANAGFEVMMALTVAIIRLAPLGVFFLMVYVTATQGMGVFRSLAWYMVAVVAALAFHACVTLPLILWFVAGQSPWKYAKAMSPALLTAFSSASSNGTLPLTLSNVENRAGISNRTSSFVLPLGATVNMDGTALYEAVAVLFIAQLHYGTNLPIVQQIIVVITALLASVGAAGIPHAGLVMMVIILQAVDLPVEKQAIILAVDRVLDMARTSVNVWSDSCGCAVVESFQQRNQAALSAD